MYTYIDTHIEQAARNDEGLPTNNYALNNPEMMQL